MKQFDSRNIDKRAEKLLAYHIELLEREDVVLEKERESYYDYDFSETGYLKIGYNKTKKLLSRTFNLEFRSVINEMNFPDDFSIKLQFEGFPHIKGAHFTGRKSSEKYAKLFQDTVFINKLVDLAKKTELAYARIDYNRSLKKIEITVCPYAGAFLWVIFPPVFYDMKLKQEEIAALYDLTEIITSYTIEQNS